MPAMQLSPDLQASTLRHGEARRLWVTWKDPVTRRRPVVGCLTMLPDRSWTFWYVQNVLGLTSFVPFANFPDIYEKYHSKEIFPMFANRLMSPQRPDYPKYLESLDLDQRATPFDMLARSAGHRKTDSVRVFPEPQIDHDKGDASTEFLAHGMRHIEGASERVDQLQKGNRLASREERDNPFDARALLLDSEPNAPVGYVPELLLEFAHTLLAHQGLAVQVLRVNPPTVPLTRRLLCRMTGPWPAEARLFSGGEYEPLPEDQT